MVRAANVGATKGKGKHLKPSDKCGQIKIGASFKVCLLSVLTTKRNLSISHPGLFQEACLFGLIVKLS